MKPPPLPDWLLYAAALGLVLVVAQNRQERTNAPAPPPPVPGEESVPLSADLPFDPAGVVRAPARSATRSGTAFSVADKGVWLTARHVVQGCKRAVLMVADDKGVATDIHIDPKADLAVLTTAGGASALGPVPAKPLKSAQRGFMPGYPQGQVGEAAARYIGHATLHSRRRGEAAQPVLAWAETGRTDELKGSLAGLSGAPVLDASGAVVGVTLAESPRRGRLYSTTREAMAHALASAAVRPTAPVTEPVTADNYGRVADSLRRDLRVAKVVCLSS